MSDRLPDNLIPNFGEYSVEAVLEEYRKSSLPSASTPPDSNAANTPAAEDHTAGETVSQAPRETAEEIAERSRQLAADTFRRTLQQLRAETAQRASQTHTAAEPRAPFPADLIESGNLPEDSEADETDTPPAGQPQEEEPWPEDDTSPEESPHETDSIHDGRQHEAAGSDESGVDTTDTRERHRRRPEGAGAGTTTKGSLADSLAAPILHFAATIAARRQQRSAEAANWPDPVDVRQTPELTPAKAGKFYASLVRPIRLRCRLSTFLCVLLLWICYRFPMTGMLRASLPVQAGVSVLLTLAIMVASLDVVTTGLRQMMELRPGAEALAVLSAVLSCIDGALVLFGTGENLPFCAISGITLTAALWGERLRCTALRRTFSTAAATKTPAVLSSGPLGNKGDTCLMRAERDTLDGIVRRSESQDMCQTAYAAAAPALLAAALVLSIVACAATGGIHFIHTLSALVAVSAPLTAFICFPLPFALTSRRLRNAGAALAGFAGCADIGRTRRVVITDEDLFPPGTMRFAELNVLEGVFVGKVISYTASLLDAYGSGVSALFDELMERRGYHTVEPEEFVCHEGGGLSGLIAGERVLAGSVGFMNLMGIRLPKNLSAKNTICTAISGELVGVFAIEYIPVASVQDALVTLLRGKTQTIFAIRDFNITPAAIRQLFRVPTERFTFPSFRNRFRISMQGLEEGRPTNAVFTRSGMLPVVEATEAGRKLYTTCHTGTILSLIGATIGLFIMFLLCRAGSYDTASTGNVLSFILLWALPVIILAVGQNRS